MVCCHFTEWETNIGIVVQTLSSFFIETGMRCLHKEKFIVGLGNFCS